jgi:exonuclease SbcC
MIAQGQFIDSLVAKTEDRQKIFREIFKTHKFEKLQDELKRLAVEMEKQRDDSELKACQAALLIQSAETSERAPDVEKMKQQASKNTIPEWQVVCSLAESLIVEDSGALETLNTEIGKVDESLGALNKEIGRAEGVEKNRTALAENKKKHAELLPTLEPLQSEMDAAKAKLPEVEEKQKEIAVLNKLLPEYDELDRLHDEVKVKSEELAKNKSTLEQGMKDADKQNKALLALEQEFSNLSNAGENKARLEAESEALSKRKKDVERASETVSEFNNAEELLGTSQQSYLEADGKYKQGNEEFESKNRAFLNEQAGILAETLEEGCACPVCGSTSHPHKACKSEEAPTQQELEKLQKSLLQLQKVRNEKADAAARAKAARDAKHVELEKKLTELFGECSIEESSAKIQMEMDRVSARLTEVVAELNSENKRVARKAELEKKIPETRNLFEKTRGENVKLSEKISSDSGNLNAQTKQLDEMTKKLPYPHKAEAEKVICEKQKQVTSLQKTLQKATDAFNNRKEELANLEGQVKSLESQLEGVAEYNLEDLRKERERVTANRAAQLQAQGELNSRLSKNREAQNQIRQIVGTLDEVKRKCGWMRNLSNIANGGLTGVGKVKLETYVQASFFDRIVSRANIRFRMLSNGQYELVRRIENSKQSQSGLDLNVLDHASGKEREVKTLSGGESFLAALSLALGLADEVQCSAGGIQIDTMFIDEGFGSLDDTCLKNAVITLQNLAGDNRLVGIISHVTELERMVDTVVRVKKDENNISHVTVEV